MGSWRDPVTQIPFQELESPRWRLPAGWWLVVGMLVLFAIGAILRG